MKKLVMGILAHVDAGNHFVRKYALFKWQIVPVGWINRMLLDTYELEKARGITIF